MVNAPKFSIITPILRSLHWFKINPLAYKFVTTS